MKILIPHDVVAIKEGLWSGSKQRELALDYGVTQTTISRIMTGHEYFDTAWPDGSVGPLSITRRKEIHVGRRSRSSERVLAGMEALTAGKAEKAIRVAVEEEPEAVSYEEAHPIEYEEIVVAVPVVVEPSQKPEPKLTRQEAYSVLEEKANALEVADQEQLHAIVSDAGDSPPESELDEPALEFELEAYTWKNVLLLAGGNPFVKKAKDEDNLLLKQAIGVVFMALPTEAWESDQCATLLKSTYDVLKGEEK